MAEGYWIKRSRLAEIANAIKTKTGSNAPLKVINFASAISGIDTSGDTEGDGDVLTSALNWNDFNEYDDDNGGYILKNDGTVDKYQDEAILRLFGARIQDSETEEWTDNWSALDNDKIWLIYKLTGKVIWNVNGNLTLVNGPLTWYKDDVNVTEGTNLNGSGYIMLSGSPMENYHYVLTYGGKYLDGDSPDWIQTNNSDDAYTCSNAYGHAWNSLFEARSWSTAKTCYDCDIMLTSSNTASENSNYCQDCWDLYYAEGSDEEPEE